MKSVVRKIDKVLPMDFCRALGLKHGNEAALNIEGDKITITGVLTLCKLCGVAINRSCPLSICESCISKVKEIYTV